MPSDAEVVEVLAEWFLGADWHKGTSANEISSEALAALRSAGYAVVLAGELDALEAAMIRSVRLAYYEGIDRAARFVRDGNNTPFWCSSPKANVAQWWRESAAYAAFTKDPTNAE